MPTRRGNGESWLSAGPNAAGYWEAKVWMGLKPDGKPDRRNVRRRTRTERNRAVRELERQRDAGQPGRPGRAPTVEQLLTRHLEVVLPQRGRAPKTISDYWSKCRNDIFPTWGAIRIDQLRPEQVENGYAAMLKAGHAPGHVRKVHAILSSVLAIEAQRGNIPRNPCDLVEQPRAEWREKPTLSREQARAVLETIGDRRNAARWWTGLALGLRQGEALGLRWPYVGDDELRVWYQLQRLTWRHGCDPRHSEVCILQTSETVCGRKRGADCPARWLPGGVTPVSGALVLREIKERRRKTVPLMTPLGGLLREHHTAQAAERLAAGPLWHDGGFVFAQPNGRPIDYRRDWAEWGEILAEAGVAGSGTHLMRHSAASIAIEQGIAIEIVQELLGHSDIRVTRGYTHVSSPMAKGAARRMGQALGGSR